jgi:hypothetical protein
MTTQANSDALLDALHVSRRHVISERTNDVDQVMETVSQSVCYMMPDVTSADPDLVVLTDRGEVRDFYADERNFMEVVTSALLVELTGEWYTFLEAVSTTRQVATGTLHQNDVVVLFPVADDGIIGEILATRRPWVDIYAGLPSPPVRPNGVGDTESPRCRTVAAHDRFLEVFRTGDVEGALGNFTSEARVAVRDHARGGNGLISGSGEDTLRQRFSSVVDAITDREVVLLNRVIGDWYVFAEWLVRGSAVPDRLRDVPGGAPVELRSASIFPITEEDQFIRGEHGYSLLSTLHDSP